MKNRRIVIPGALTILALSFMAIALPAGAASPALLQANPTVDVCNPKPDVPGFINTNTIVTDEAVSPANTLILVQATDVVNVVGKTANGFWLLIQTNAGIVGWVQGKYVNKLDAKLASKLPVVDGTVAVTQAAPTEEATEEADATEAATPDCPTYTGIIVTNKTLALKEKPISSAKDLDATVKNTERVTILSYNASGSWYNIRTTDGAEGWVGFANVTIVGAKPNIPHDYSFVEVTLTPTGQ